MKAKPRNKQKTATAMATPQFRMTHSVAVRPHKSGAWTAVIGKRPNASGTALKPRQFYLKGTEVAAQAEAERLLSKWQFIFKHWATNYQPTLKTLGSPFADEPHWDAALGELTEADAEYIKEHVDRPPTSDEIGEAYAAVSLLGVFSLYKTHREMEVSQRQVDIITVNADFKNIRCGMKFFPTGAVMDGLTLAVISEAKTKMLSAVSRRTAKNYLGAMKAMLKWFYDGSDYGKWHEKPTNFDGIFGVANANRTDIKTHEPTTLKALLEKADDRQRLYIMLALNCGMYQADIGRLERSEINIDKAYIFWDRSKEPQNPFKVKHDLWAETLTLVKQFIQTEGDLAFLADKGKPLYTVNAKGNTHDRISEAYRPLRSPFAPQFHELRKSTNQALLDLLHGETENLEAVSEISKQFLGEKTPHLSRVYATSGMKTYNRMNHHLKAVEKHFREKMVFDCLK